MSLFITIMFGIGTIRSMTRLTHKKATWIDHVVCVLMVLAYVAYLDINLK